MTTADHNTQARTQAAERRGVRRARPLRGLLAGCAVLASVAGVSAAPGGVGGVGGAGGGSVGQGGYTGDYVPEPERGLAMKYNFGKALPMDLAFTDSTGMPVHLRDAFSDGRPVLIVMLYFRCPLQCPRVVSSLTSTLNDLDFTVGKDFNVLFVSFDHRDTPTDAAAEKEADLLTYDHGKEAGVADHWHVWTSRPENAKALADALGFPYKYLPDIGEYSHPTVVFVATPLRDQAEGAAGAEYGEGGGGGGRISRYLTGLEYPVKDLRLALLEATDGKIGTLWDRVPLWCYHWDPKAGTYTIAAFRVMQAGAALTVVFLGGLLLVMWRRERALSRKAALAEAAAGGGAGRAGVAGHFGGVMR